jgi:hypothetical protein
MMAAYRLKYLCKLIGLADNKVSEVDTAGFLDSGFRWNGGVVLL